MRDSGIRAHQQRSPDELDAVARVLGQGEDVRVGLIVGGLTFLSGEPAAGAVLAGLAAFGVSVPALHALIGRPGTEEPRGGKDSGGSARCADPKGRAP